MLILNILEGPDTGRQFELPDDEPQLLGRSSEALPLTDTTISRRHAELTPDDGDWYIHDLHSSNGTFVNGQHVTEPTRLMNGDLIRVGATLLQFGRVLESQEPPQVLALEKMASSVESVVTADDHSMIGVLSRDTEAAAQHLTIFYELMQIVGSTFQKKQLLDRVMDLIFQHFQPDRGFILLGGPNDPRPGFQLVRHRDPAATHRHDKITVSHTIIRHVLQKAEGVLSTNAQTDERFDVAQSIRVEGIRSAICVPLKFRERIFGVIYIDSLLASRVFTEDQLRLLTAIGMQTGLAIEHAELHQHHVGQARLAAVGETVASLSHSIRNMLQAIRGGAEVVDMGLRKKEMDLIQSGWDILCRNLDRVYELTMNMLAFSKQRKPEFEMVNLPRLLEEIAELTRAQCQRKNVRLLTKFNPDMPPVPADPAGIHQAVMNLINNALDAVEPEKGILTLECDYDPKGHWALITITDNGCGIDQDTLKQLFKPFFSTKGMRGTGLGLAVTQKVVKEHGGGIRLESLPGVGTSFTLRLSTESRKDPAATDA